MQRQLQQVLKGQATSDGAGVQLSRTLGQSRFARLDPFLMLDEFGSSEANDYIAGFPSHPHRGFETVTYMLEGHMLHEDHLGNKGHLRSGDVQWMTAGRGIIHSEMPQQEEGTMRGFQLWINLPAAEKMKPAHYQDIPVKDIPIAALSTGGTVKVIAGSIKVNEQNITGPVQDLSTQARYIDLHLNENESFEHDIDKTHNSFIYVYEGEVSVGTEGRHLAKGHLGILQQGDEISVKALKPDTRLLWLSAQPIGEPVVQYGPFVMNTMEEIEQAITDYQQGNFGQ